MQVNLANYKLLVIDDFSQFRLTLKSMLERKGAGQVDQAASALEALKQCGDNRYDVIFCDYNLGEGQDGQQLLEELHQRSMLPRSCLFMMVTAEMVSAQVIGALEYRPDAYLAKPFPFEQLSLRLDRLIARREILKEVYRALDAGLVEEAMVLCDRVMQQVPTARFFCLRIKSEVLEQQQEFDRAKAIYEEVVKEQPLLWAMVGIGKLLYNTGRLDEALEHFRQMRVTFPRQVSVIDWIAHCLQKMGEIEESEEALRQAIEISPKSVSRQSRLGEIAESLGHHDVAQKAFSRTINEGQHSCLLSAEHYRRYYDNTRQILTELNGRDRSRMVAETEKVAKKMEARYRNDPSALAQNQCALAGFFASVNRNDQSSRYLNKLSQTLENPDCKISEEACAYIEENLRELESATNDEKPLKKISERMGDFKQTIEQARKQDGVARGINQQGILLLKQKDTHAALIKFREAVVEMPENPTYLLNAAQMVLLDDDMRADPDFLAEARDWMQRIDLKPGDERRPLYLMLHGRLPNA